VGLILGYVPATAFNRKFGLELPKWKINIWN
jgi:hypothetical protein